MAVFNTEPPLFPEIISLHGKWKGNKTALIYGDQNLSWRDLNQAANQIANGLNKNGIGPGSMVGLVMKNGRQMVESILGIMKSGAASVPINLSVSNDALAAMLKDADVKAIIATRDQTDRLQGYGASALAMPILIASNATDDAFEAFKAEHPLTNPTGSISPDAPLNVIYSSGTTGTPKGIVHTHAGRRDWAYDISIALRYDSSARTLFNLGLYSNISWVGFVATLLAGGTLIIHDSYHTAHTLATIQNEKITNFSMVPIQYQRLLEDPTNGDYDLSSLKAVMSCGSPLHKDLRHRLFDRLGPVVIELFGLTEGVATTLDPEEAEGRMGSAGKPLVGTDIKIISDDHIEVSQGQTGEIVATGRILMPGYLNRPDATMDAVWTDEDGQNWLRTGDIGMLDEEGYLYIVDRKKDMILSGGQNIYPQDIEAILLEHPAVTESAVIGAESATWGETPLAIVVVDTATETLADEIKAWANSKLGKQQRIAGVEIAVSLPRNPNGKTLKKTLRETYSYITFQ
ncbi:MAG: long-chain fatty acid--CoA ligase [Kordiimonadales bacterium]|nr:MAG: long-chain fatty acid--CoA ligase [Kordiimonadales bacterium]